MEKETEKIALTLDKTVVRRLKAAATIERRRAQEIVAQALAEYFERMKLKV